MEEKMENKNTEKAVKKTVLIYFAEPVTEKMYKYWSEIFKVPAVDGYKIAVSSKEYRKVKLCKKVLLIITVRGANEDYIKKIEELGFKSEDITLFTVQPLQADMCIYAQKQGIKVVQLPLLKSKLEDYL